MGHTYSSTSNLQESESKYITELSYTFTEREWEHELMQTSKSHASCHCQEVTTLVYKIRHCCRAAESSCLEDEGNYDLADRIRSYRFFKE